MKRHILAFAALSLTTAALAQDLRSAYFTDDYKYRHDLNAAFGNSQNYIALPVLGNLNVAMQGNFGLGDLLFQNPRTGRYDRTFMHPDVSVNDALSGLNSGTNLLRADASIAILSAGFKGFGGYNTIEINSKVMAGVRLPYDLFEFAKNIGNKHYQFDDFGLRALSYAEIAFGHSRDLSEKLRVGAKAKVLLGVARADLSVEGLSADLTGDVWTLNSGTTQAEIQMKGLQLVNTVGETYNNGRPDVHVDLGETDVDGAGIGGFGLGLDLGAVYKVTPDLTVSASLHDLGFISWSNNHLLRTKSSTFTFHGFHDVAVKDTDGDPQSIESQADDYEDQLSDFINLTNEGDQGGKTTLLGATATLAAEYKLPVYRRLSFGLVGTHRFQGDYSWTEGRLSANWTPLKWLDGGVNLGVSTFATSAGWVINVHPKAVNFFVGMDHILGKQSKEGIPLSSNASVNLGLNVAF